MALTPAFTISQSPLTPSLVTATDTSTGSDVAVTQRRIYFQTTAGTYLVETGTTTDYEAWALIDTSDTWDILLTDYALSITVQWLNVSNTVLYTLSQVFCLEEYNKQFLVYLGQLLALSPSVIQDVNYSNNLATFWSYVQYASSEVTIAGDIANSQNLLDKASFMRANETKFF